MSVESSMALSRHPSASTASTGGTHVMRNQSAIDGAEGVQNRVEVHLSFTPWMPRPGMPKHVKEDNAISV
jgi:hypothetical protein